MKNRFVLMLLNLLGLVFIVLLLSSFISLWLLELYVSLAAQIFYCGLVAFVCLLLVHVRMTKGSLSNMGLKSRWNIIPALGLISLAIFMGMRVGTGHNQPDASLVTDLTIATYNKLLTAPEMNKAVDYFKNQNVDVIFMQETYPEEASGLAKALGFEYVFATDGTYSAGNTEIAVISRYEFKDQTTANNSDRYKRAIQRAIINVNSKDIALYNTHVTPPFYPDYYASGNNELDSAQQVVVKEDLPLVFGGDLNTTVYSPGFKQLEDTLRENNITNTTQGVFPACSWYSGLSSKLCLRVDHFFVSDEFELNSTDISPELESDHRALIIKIKI